MPASIQSTLERHLSSCEIVRDGIYRCEKRMRGETGAYAVYYVDSTGELPSDTTELLSYEEKYLADRYYKQPKHLRWNHYLVFAVEKEKWEQAASTGLKGSLERDTSYARKFVVPLADLETFFTKTSLLVPKQDEPGSDPTERLLEVLRSTRLDHVIFGRFRNRAIESWLSGEFDDVLVEKRTPKKTVAAKAEDKKAILSLRWNKFRRFPERKEFQFGRVNLITGPNGSGKTSLLEAIEAYFCGGARRDGGGGNGSDIEGKLLGDERFKKLAHSADVHRERDLRWFSAYWRRKDELNVNFNRYIFFSSDAAYELEHADKGRFVTSALANLALGTEARELWGLIQEFRKHFQDEQERLEKRFAEIVREIQAIRGSLAHLKRLPSATASKLEAVKRALADSGWRRLPESPDVFEKAISARLSEVHRRLQSHVGGPTQVITVGGLRRYVSHFQNRKVAVDDAIRAFQKHGAEIRGIEDKRTQAGEVNKRLADLKVYFGAGWISKYAELSHAQKEYERLSRLLGDIADEHLDQLPEQSLKMSMGDAVKKYRDERESASDEVKRGKRLLARAGKAAGELQRIRSQIRALGQEFLAELPDATTCPLCRHVHPPGMFATAVHGDEIDQGQAGEVTALQRAMARSERKLADAARIAEVLEYLHRCGQLMLQRPAANQATVIEVKKLASEALKAKHGEERKLSLHAAAMRRMGGGDLSEAEFRNLWLQVFKTQADPLDESLEDKLGQAVKQAAQRLAELDRSLDSLRRAQLSCKRSVEKILSEFNLPTDMGDAPSKVRMLLDNLRTMQSEIDEASKDVMVDPDLKLQEAVRRIGVANDLGKELLEGLSAERARLVQEQSYEKQLLAFEQGRAVATSRLGRARTAVQALEKIEKDHNLDKVVANFIEKNCARISETLRLIHAPREFSGIASFGASNDGVDIRLVREGDAKKSIGLSQISTGQRSAVALSIFFALNAKSKLAPPIIMMDDPVAQVDDLNTLALLDYIREVAKDGARQIFFATANEKLASIFRQKFAAFEDEFVSIELSRT